MSEVFAERFKLIREIGAGAMGSIWLAEHRSLGAPVVIKVLKSDLARHPDARARFQREARIAAQMRSVHVAQVLDHGVTAEGELYLVMEHLEGETLRARLRAVKTLSPMQTAAILSQICRAVTKAHEAGLVHRDLKPENIFLARDVGLEVAKVLDFGIVKVPDALAFDGVSPTITGALLGTPCYMSPEQALGLKAIDFRADLWSLGVMVYECLTGARPFRRRSLAALIRQITIEPIPLPSQVAPGAGHDGAIDAWMSRALARDPAARFPDARELAESFQHLAEKSEPVGPTQDAPPQDPVGTPREPALEEATTLVDHRRREGGESVALKMGTVWVDPAGAKEREVPSGATTLVDQRRRP